MTAAPIDSDLAREETSGERAEAAFERVYREHVPAMRRLAMQRFRIGAADAEALVHDVLIGYLANPGVVRGSLKGYFAGAMSNAAMNYWRKRKPEHTLPIEIDGGGSNEPERLATRLALESTLERLPQRSRETLCRHYLEGESVAEIAAALDLDPTHVKVILHRGRLSARKIFESLTQIV